jgi:hypothetical protein
MQWRGMEENQMKRLLMVIAATAVLAACGSAAADDPQVASLSTSPADDATTGTGDTTDSVTDTTVITDPNEAALQFAKCMREHGIDMPDPQVSDDGGVLVQIGTDEAPGGETGPSSEDFEAANEDCQHFMEDAATAFEPLSEEDQKKMQEEALAFSKCMRDHGIDIPDPQFSGDAGGFNVSIGSPDAGSEDQPMIDFDSDEFKEANEACGGPDGGGFVVSAKPADG